MNKESIIINFIRDNLKVLQQKDFPEEFYKNSKHEYFIQRKNLVGKPKDTEIAQTTTMYMIKKSMIKDEIKLKEFLELPFFKKNVLKPNIFFEALKLKNPDSFVIIDPSKLDNAEYLQRVEDEIKQKVITENKSEFDEQTKKFKIEIEDVKKELATIPTRLEKQEFVEPITIHPEEQQQLEWWQTLNLREDPFLLAEGLQKINRDFYEDIIVRTEIFNRYVNYIEKLRDQIFKNTIFYGDFGSGKTAFFNYLQKTLLQHKILSTYVQIWAGLDSDTNIHSFKEDLVSSLKIECRRYGVDFIDNKAENHLNRIKNILFELTAQKGFQGFVIFVDDLHKNNKAFGAVIDFLSYLQIFTSGLSNGGELNVTTYVAGIPQWKSKIQSEPRLSGSLIRDEIMPEISEQNAFDMLNKRMLTFSKNQDKKNIIGRGFVKQVYDNLKQNKATVTFRDFVRQTLEEFRNNNFDRVLTVNPKAIPTETVHEIKSMIYKIPKLNYQFEQLFTLLQNVQEENRQKCFEVLGDTYLEGGMYENSPQGERNLWAIQKLERSGLVNYHSDDIGIKWIVNKELRTLNQEIIDKFNISMEDYLIPAFIGNPILKSSNTASPELEILTNIANSRIDPNEAKMVEKVIADYKPLLRIHETHTINIVPNELVEKCLTSLVSLTNAFMFLQSIPKIEGRDQEIISFWKDFWYKPSSLIEFINQIESNEKIDINIANYIFGIYKEAVTEITIFFKNQIEKDRIFSISYMNLTNEDCEKIDKCREMWMNKKYYEMCSDITGYLEIKLRQHVFNVLTLFYGDSTFRGKRYEKYIQEKIYENIKKDEKKGMSQIFNELQFFDRKDYKRFMTKNTKEKYSDVGHKNWMDIFSEIFLPWNEEQLFNFLNMFGDFNTAIAHNKTESIDSKNQPELRQYLMDSIFFLQKLNAMYKKILERGVVKINSEFYFNFKQTIDLQNQMEVKPSMDEYKRIVKRMAEMEEIEVIIDDQDFIQSFYNMDYRKFILIIQLLLNLDPVKRKEIGAHLIMLNEKSPVFLLKLNKIN
jgi:hypothetical protein